MPPYLTWLPLFPPSPPFQRSSTKLYNGGEWNPAVTGPLTQPGLNVHVGDCILAIDGHDLTAAEDIQKPLESTAGHAITLKIAASAVVPGVMSW